MSIYSHKPIQREAAYEIVDQYAERFDERCLTMLSRWMGYLLFAAAWLGIVWWIA